MTLHLFIMQGQVKLKFRVNMMKKKMGSILIVVMMVLACAYPNGQNAEKALESKNDTVMEPVEREQILAPDLNHNGIAERVRVAKTNEGRHLMIWEDDEWLCREDSYFTQENQGSIFLCTLDGEDYLLRYRPKIDQGICTYEYEISFFEGSKKKIAGRNSIDFDINFGSPIHEDFEPETIAVFMHEINELLSHSVQLLNTDNNLLATFEKEGCLYDSLWWLDNWEPAFVRDEGKSLLENLKDFQTTMTIVQKPADPVEIDCLPIDESLEMSFYSGSGGWRTRLILNPDGSFLGDYVDGDWGPDYPEQKICQFHGQFGEMKKLSDASWSLTLEKLEIDTSHSIGEEWDVTDEYGTVQVHYISREPYGLDGDNGMALKPGARFILYSPEAAGHEPGTELYGAIAFQDWMHKNIEFTSDADVLGCWGLQNVEMGYGFFSENE